MFTAKLVISSSSSSNSSSRHSPLLTFQVVSTLSSGGSRRHVFTHYYSLFNISYSLCASCFLSLWFLSLTVMFVSFYIYFACLWLSDSGIHYTAKINQSCLQSAFYSPSEQSKKYLQKDKEKTHHHVHWGLCLDLIRSVREHRNDLTSCSVSASSFFLSDIDQTDWEQTAK